MRKFIASILAVCIVLSSFGLCAVAASDRAINVYVDKTELFAEEIVTVTVKIEGRDDLANARYNLNFNPSYFEYQEDPANTTGVINEMLYIEDGTTYADGEVLKTYTFKAIAQPTEVTDTFCVTEGSASTYLESIDGVKVTTDDNCQSVTIKLIQYGIEKYVDGDLVDETAGPVTYISFPYDNDEHTFEIKTIPTATVNYTVNGTSASEVKFTAEDTYVVEYEVVNATGYDTVTGTFTVVIEKPVFVVELGAKDYVKGKAIVLVYTNTENVFFSYGDAEYEMVDVSNNGYKYNETDVYPRVFAYVTDPTANDELDEYKANVIHWYNDEYEKPEVGAYDNDMNYDGFFDVLDITTAFGISNAVPQYFTSDKYQRNILKLDVNGSKHIDGDDTGVIVDTCN